MSPDRRSKAREEFGSFDTSDPHGAVFSMTPRCGVLPSPPERWPCASCLPRALLHRRSDDAWWHRWLVASPRVNAAAACGLSASRRAVLNRLHASCTRANRRSRRRGGSQVEGSETSLPVFDVIW